MNGLDWPAFDTFLLAQNGKIIHQIWFGTIPNKKEAKLQYNSLRYCRESWVLQNPSWHRIEWNREMTIQLVSLFYSEYFDLFSKYRYKIQQCDFIRYLILYRYGGWYVDMDYFCNAPLDRVMNLFPNSIYFVQSPNKTLVQDDDHISNSLMYSVPKHPFWKRVFDELLLATDKPYYPKHLTVMFTTGPGILNRIYTKYKYKYRVKSLPWEQFHPYGISDEITRLKGTKNVYAIHIGTGSWESKDSKFFLTLATDWKVFVFVLVVYFTLVIYIRNFG
jgi:mannosyltransferase OCH1-like enzyme